MLNVPQASRTTKAVMSPRTKVQLGLALGIVGAVFSSFAAGAGILPQYATLNINNAQNVYRTPLVAGPSVVLGRLNIGVTGGPVKIESLNVLVNTNGIPASTVGEPYRLHVYVCGKGTGYGYGGYGYGGYGYDGSCFVTIVTSHTVVSKTATGTITRFTFPNGFIIPANSKVWVDGVAQVYQPAVRQGKIKFSAHSVVASSANRTLFQTVSATFARERRVLATGDRIRVASNPTVFYLARDGRRYAFPNMTTHNTWFKDQLDIVEVDRGTLLSFPIGGNVTIRPGTHLIKIATDPKVYAVTPGKVLREIPSEAIGVKLYGPTWRSRIVVVPDAFFVNYVAGAPLTATAHPDGTIIRYARSSTSLYLISGGKKRLMTTTGFADNFYQSRFIVENVPLTFAYPLGTNIVGFERTLTTPAGP